MSSLSWERADVDGQARFVVKGDINESSALGELAAAIQSNATLNLAGVRRINSRGIREWMDFMEALKAAGRRVVLEDCSPVVVSQLSTVRNFADGAEVRSVAAPYYCTACKKEHVTMVKLPLPPLHTFNEPRACPSCGKATEFDDVPMVYFGFAGAEARK